MSDQYKRCETCKHYDAGGADFIGDNPEYGFCVAPVPDAVMVDSREIMQPEAGTRCHCWEAKE